MAVQRDKNNGVFGCSGGVAAVVWQRWCGTDRACVRKDRARGLPRFYHSRLIGRVALKYKAKNKQLRFLGKLLLALLGLLLLGRSFCGGQFIFWKQ